MTFLLSAGMRARTAVSCRVLVLCELEVPFIARAWRLVLAAGALV
jgi:hypothetical protein